MKIILILLMLVLTFNVFGQEIRGHLLYSNLCEFLDSGGYKIIKTNRYYQTFAKITQDKFYISGQGVHLFLNLEDKQVDSSDKDNMVVHFLSTSYKKLYMVAATECEGNIKVGVFPMDGKNRFTEYIFKPIKKK